MVVGDGPYAVAGGDVGELSAFNDAELVPVEFGQYAAAFRSVDVRLVYLPQLAVLGCFAIVAQYESALGGVAALAVPSGQRIVIELFHFERVYVSLVEHSLHVVVVDKMSGIFQIIRYEKSEGRK